MLDLHLLKTKRNIILKYKELLSLKKLDKNEILTILKFMFELTPTGFEEYVASYFREIEQYENIKVTGGLMDKGIDIKGQKGGHMYAMQCKKFGASHVTEKDILYFIQNTKEIKQRLGDTLSLYFITTSWVNQNARARAKEYGIKIFYYRDMLNMNKKFPIQYFIEKNKNNRRITEKIRTTEVLNMYYLRRFISPMRFADIVYRIIIKIDKNYTMDFSRIEKDHPEKYDELYYLTKNSPIKNTITNSNFLNH